MPNSGAKRLREDATVQWLNLLNMAINSWVIWIPSQRNILHEISERNSNWIGHNLHRNCLLQQVIDGKIKGGIEVTGRRGWRRRKLLDDLQERRWYSHLKEGALDRTILRIWRAGFGRGFGPVVRQTAELNEWMNIFTKGINITLFRIRATNSRLWHFYTHVTV
jgi:hypothetical protein